MLAALLNLGFAGSVNATTNVTTGVSGGHVSVGSGVSGAHVNTGSSVSETPAP